MTSALANCLVPIGRQNWREALRVRVSDEQLAMVADSQPVALVILAKAYVQDGDRRWEPLAYLGADGSIVDVLALVHVGDVAEVRNLAVHVTRQGSGVGLELMGAVLEWCRDQQSRSVELTCHPANEVAARLYRRVGFEPTGETRNGEPLWRAWLGGAPRR